MTNPTTPVLMPLELALSGGGVRAMAFHAGVLRYLAEHDALHRVRHISTVSGGSLLIGLLFHRSHMRWPSAAAYRDEIGPAIRRDMTTLNLPARALMRLAWPSAWRFALSRANLLARTLESAWGMTATLADLPAFPEWSINGTTAETGRRFRFKAGDCGDYQLGYAEAKQFPLAQALAVSAAFPGGIGPLSIKTSQYVWRRRPHWGATTEEVVLLPHKKLHLYDGGIYDNLGLEPLYDIGKRCAKAPGAALIVSDAGAPLRQGFSLGALNPWRMKRLMDITMEQQRALRVRVIANELQSGLAGAYLMMGTSAAACLAKAGAPTSAHTWLSQSQARAVADTPTSLGKLSTEDFDRIERHGYETAMWNDIAYPYLSGNAQGVADAHGRGERPVE